MTLPVTFHSLAEDELNEAASYYEFEGSGLGFAFVEAVRAAVAQITAFPQAAKLITVGTPQTLTRFPLLLALQNQNT